MDFRISYRSHSDGHYTYNERRPLPPHGVQHMDIAEPATLPHAAVHIQLLGLRVEGGSVAPGALRGSAEAVIYLEPEVIL